MRACHDLGLRRPRAGHPHTAPLDCALPVGSARIRVATVSQTELGDRFTGNMLLAGTAALSVAYSVGGIVGPLVAGAAMDALGPDGLPVSLGLTTVLLLAVAALGPLTATKSAEEVTPRSRGEADRAA
jgi:hypothetical protein